MKSAEALKHTPHLMIRQIGEDGGNGEGRYGKLAGSVIWSFGGGWDHGSGAPYQRSYVPSWEDMCRLKDMFFREDETVVQYHPAKSEYVNTVENCLHLWRPQNETLPTPPSIMVGVKNGQSAEEIRQAIADILDIE